MATGNLGKRLTGNDERKNLYLSRDGGMTWKSVKTGLHIYEIADHGALLVIAKKDKSVNFIEYSVDEGITWQTRQISERGVIVHNIISEPEGST